MKARSASLPQNQQLLAPSVGTSEFNWLSKDSWEPEHKIYFARTSRPPALGIFAPPPYRRLSRYQGSPRPLMEWVLLDQDRVPIAIAEAVARPSTFFEVILTITGDLTGPVDGPSPLAYLIASLLIQLPVDRLQVQSDSPLPKEFQVIGAFRTLLTPWRRDAIFLAPKPLVTTQILDLTPAQWWATAMGIQTKKALHYIEHRLGRSDLQENFAHKTRRSRLGFGLISRLLRWQ